MRHDRRTCAKLCHSHGGELEQIQFLLGHASALTTERYLGCKQNLGKPVNDRFNLGSLRLLPDNHERNLLPTVIRRIGIGGRVTPPPLPHHQDMRVRIRRFGGLS